MGLGVQSGEGRGLPRVRPWGLGPVGGAASAEGGSGSGPRVLGPAQGAASAEAREGSGPGALGPDHRDSDRYRTGTQVGQERGDLG